MQHGCHVHIDEVNPDAPICRRRRRRDDGDIHMEPFQRIPFQTLRIIQRTIDDGEREIEKDSDTTGQTIIKVDIDGELVGTFAMGDEGQSGVGDTCVDHPPDCHH